MDAEIIATVVFLESAEDEVNGSRTYPCTRVFRFEFETVEDALGFLDTSEDIPGLVDADEITSPHQPRVPEQCRQYEGGRD
jgi:hypothetical protein